MIRARHLGVGVLCALAACSDSAPDSVTIKLFQAAPDAIAIGQSTTLVFLVEPADAHVIIDGMGDMTRKTQAVVSPAVTTTYHLTASKGDATADNSVTVTVGAQDAVAFDVAPAAVAPVAGVSIPVTLTALAGPGQIAPGFRGTLHLTSSDPRAELPFEVVFTAQDAGVKHVVVTLKTAGPRTLTAADKTNDLVRGTASLTVDAAAASSCVASQAPAQAVAGSAFGLTVALHDSFDNVADGYTGTIGLTATDPRALIPAAVSYAAGDAGSHAFSTVLLTTGSHVVTASDTGNPAIHCSVALTVTPAAPKLVLGAPAVTNAGYPVPVTIAVKDLFDNAIPGYAGTVTLASSDTGPGAVVPPPIQFTGAEGGVATATATLVTRGLQTIAARSSDTPAATAQATSAVQGLSYTPPASGRVRLVANPAQSTAQVIQLDLIANERLEVSSLFGGGPGSFAAGMNLPLDTSRAAADVALFTPGNALPLGTGVPAAIGRIGETDHILYTAVSRKRVAGPIFNQGTEVAAGRVFYSVRLKLQPGATPGAVFDGAQPVPELRAAVRDQYGDDFVSLGDFGVGRLEVQ